MMGPSVGRASHSTRSKKCIPARQARPSRRLASWSTKARHYFFSRARATVVAACSRRNAVQTRLSAESNIASMKRLAMLPGLWPKRKRSSNHAATESALRCCLHISRASCGSAGCVCGARVMPSSSLRSQPPHRTCGIIIRRSPVKSGPPLPIKSMTYKILRFL